MTDRVPNEEAVTEDEAAVDPHAAGDAAETPDAGGPDLAVGAGDPKGAKGGGLRSELDELNDRHLRLAAEFNNFRRRSEQERLGAWARAQADLVAKFLDVLDDLNRVAQLDLSNATVETIMEGIDLVERKFVRMLEDTGVEVIDPAGEAFDPERMEAVMRVPVDAEEKDDEVAQVFQKGYTLKGVLVRPARVSVFKQE